MPFLLNAMGVEPRHNYTAVIYVQIGAALGPNAALYKLVRTITKSQFVDRVSINMVTRNIMEDFKPNSSGMHRDVNWFIDSCYHCYRLICSIN